MPLRDKNKQCYCAYVMLEDSVMIGYFLSSCIGISSSVIAYRVYRLSNVLLTL
jgi:hypothetical protein